MNVENYLILARAAAKGSNHGEAHKYWSLVLEGDPRNVEAWIGKATAVGWASDFSNEGVNEAKSCLNQAVELGIPNELRGEAAAAAYRTADLFFSRAVMAHLRLYRLTPAAKMQQQVFLEATTHLVGSELLSLAWKLEKSPSRAKEIIDIWKSYRKQFRGRASNHVGQIADECKRWMRQQQQPTTAATVPNTRQLSVPKAFRPSLWRDFWRGTLPSQNPSSSVRELQSAAPKQSDQLAHGTSQLPSDSSAESPRFPTQEPAAAQRIIDLAATPDNGDMTAPKADESTSALSASEKPQPKLTMDDLTKAAEHDDLDTIAQALDQGLEINKLDSQGWTALCTAAEFGNVATLQFLLDRGANVNRKRANGQTPLFNAAHRGSPDVTRALIDAGADLNAKDIYGWVPLNSTLTSSESDTQMQVIELLLSNGADPNLKNEDGWTPLHTAARNIKVRGAKLLLKFGADVNAVSKYGVTPLEWLRHDNRGEEGREMEELLISAVSTSQRAR